ncbi:DUF2325 domain-containing protein [Caloramator sp. mosi_1]|uniref:DUF2325 domain-containing protein n=1 Tax=Caloramator sp. mosi_1 TaxID=3023090 RepID=UPI00235E21CF|nr:DUF2325 domain-containing protein [Caloramator sp. mosi_1]WDC84674.1 DUF2325 domain-containing protein [Caloramator sp. mosi_1]
MSALIIGGDKIDTVIKGLKNKEFDEIKHISGRKNGDKINSSINKAVKYDLVIVLTDYINHCIVTNLKNCNSKNRIIYCKRSWPLIEENIKKVLKF